MGTSEEQNCDIDHGFVLCSLVLIPFSLVYIIEEEYNLFPTKPNNISPKNWNEKMKRLPFQIHQNKAADIQIVHKSCIIQLIGIGGHLKDNST